MSRCKSTKKSSVTNAVILVCDLDDGHEVPHPKHWDKLEQCTWNHASNDPTPLQSTRTSPNPSHPDRKAKKAVTSSVAAHTGKFEVISV